MEKKGTRALVASSVRPTLIALTALACFTGLGMLTSAELALSAVAGVLVPGGIVLAGYALYEHSLSRKKPRGAEILAEAEAVLLQGQHTLLEEMVRIESTQSGQVVHAEANRDPQGRPTFVLDLICDPGKQVGYSPEGEVVYRNEVDTPFDTVTLVGPFAPEGEELLEHLTTTLAGADEPTRVTLGREFHKTPEGYRTRGLTVSSEQWSVTQRYV